MSKISLEKFIENTKGQRIDVSWGEGRLKGQCVSLIQQYISQCLEQPAKARGNAVDWKESYVNEGLGTITNSPRKGDLLVFPNEANGLGHIAIYIDENTMYDQNNLRHDNGCSGYANILPNYVALRPNAELYEEPKNECKYLNLEPSYNNEIIDSWRVYDLDVEPIKGNEKAQINPAQFGGLSYLIKELRENIAVIETDMYGTSQIYINHPACSITDSPKFEHGKY